MSAETIRLTMSQALVRYLIAQQTVLDGATVPLIPGVFAIFGHGNVAGLGEALAGVRSVLPTYRAHNEQAGACGHCLREGDEAPAVHGVHHFDWSGRDQHGDRCCARRT